jgi:hypothetical protein
MGRKPNPEQAARFERFCAALVRDIRLSAFRAALLAGYTPRMAKSKSYKLAQRARKRPGFRKARERAAFGYAAEKNREYFLERQRQSELRRAQRAAAKW